MRALRALAAVVVVLCVAVLVTAGTLRATVLDRGFYQGALDEERAYHRLYDEVLVDPQAQPVTRSLLARLPVPEAVVTANLKNVLPPATVRQLTNDQIGALLAYLRGDTGTVDLSVDLTPVLANLTDLAEVYLGGLVSGAERRSEADLDTALQQMEGALEDVAAGRRPAGLPKVELGDEAVGEATRVLLAGVPQEDRAALRPQVQGALRVGDVATALAAVGPSLAGTPADTGGEKAQRDLLRITDGGQWDIAEDLENSGADTGVLKAARGLTHHTLGLVRTLTVAAGAAAVVFLWIFGPRRRVRRLRTVGRLLVGGGVLTAAVFGVAWWRADAWLWTPPQSWPPALAALVWDLERAGARSLATAGLLACLLPLILGALVWAFSTAWERHARGGVLSPRARNAVLGGVGALVTTVVVIGPALAPTAARGSERMYCNGSAALCALPYDEAAYLTTHNAMSSTAGKFISPVQDGDILTQLEGGARALLIDTHTWERRGEIAERLKLSEFAPDMRGQITGVIDEASPPEPGLWLCHAICRAGAVPLVETLREVGDWLEEHPQEVVTLIVQDGVSGERTASAFRRAGLKDLLFTPDADPGAPWPTLGRMVQDDTRLVVFPERSDGPAPWYRNFYRYGMETPYSFASPSAMTCAPNRGGTGKGLFLLNHFVTHGGGSRIDAREVNARDFVLARARRCAAERGRPVNFVAVDFVNLGDARAAVDALNARRTSS